MPNGTGFATVTVANSPVGFSYVGSGGAQALAIGFIPTALIMFADTLSWAWVRGMSFGNFIAINSPSTANTGGVLDVLDGSGAASSNTATTSQVIGLLIGTSTTVNNGGAVQYYGLAIR